MSKRRASCVCGQLSVVCEGEPVRISICHCLPCQQRTGSVFGVQARFPRSQTHAEGRASKFQRAGDSGNIATFSFCPVCGVSVYWEPETMPDFVMVAVGAFADPQFPPPKVAVYEERAHPWATLPDLELERMH